MQPEANSGGRLILALAGPRRADSPEVIGMNTYIRERLRADAAHVVARAAAEQLIVHKGLRGRFRELLVDAILAPWLPPYAGCATGMIVDQEDRTREATQEDVVIFDRSLVPAVLAHTSAMEGVFPFDGVLARVEVKSLLTRGELEKAVRAANEVHRMKFCGPPGRLFNAPISTVFAFGSDLVTNPIGELERLLSVVDECGLHYQDSCPDIPGPILAVCVVGRGCWTFGRVEGENGKSGWLQAKMNKTHDEVLHFVGTLSNSCFNVHVDREGRQQDEKRGAGGGIGNFILTWDTFEVSPVQQPRKAGS
jgi:hypothetical protein